MIRDLGNELIKMAYQKKNYIPVVGYVIFVLLCYLAWKTSQAVLIKRVMSFGIDKV